MASGSFAQKLIVVGVLGVGAIGAIVAFRGHGQAGGARDDVVSPEAKDPRQVLGRPWFDHYPKSRNEEVDLWWFSGAGIGIHDRGSVWRSTMDFFDFERQGSRLDVRFLHDKKKEAVRFEVVACDDKPPFDVCLDVKEPLRGKKRFYSFGYDEDMDANVPWAREWRAAAEARSRAAR